MYSVSKWAVTALAENTRMMVVEDGVGVTLVAPGRVDSPFWAHRRSDVRDGAPAAPMLSPEGVADVIVWALAQPNGVDVNCIVVRPKGQIS
jgi:NADP-dependent 3-hydroxy acid dehydrogenase YdfG